jgi:transcriptional regulator GlxA family with amidase domain
MTARDQGEKTIAVVLYPGLTLLDVVGPLQPLTMLERLAPQFRTVVVAERLEPMATDVDVAMMPSATFAQVPHPFAIVVPGGRRATIRQFTDPAMREYVRTAAASAEIVASVCTGSLILASVGLLSGRPATTNWFYHRILRSFGAKYRRRRWVHDGKYVTSAGVSAGIDMALYLVSQLTDEATARKVQLALDYDPRPPRGPIDWDQVDLLPRLMRTGVGVIAPIVTARPKLMTRAERSGHASSA